MKNKNSNLKGKDNNKNLPENDLFSKFISRRSFLYSAGIGGIAAGLVPACISDNKADKKKTIQGFEDKGIEDESTAVWTPISDRKIRVGIVGYGECEFGAVFGFQDHPNVDIVAVSDLIPERCNKLAKACSCSKTYPSLEEMIKDDNIEAIFVATDAPSHARHSIEALKYGKHVACAVPAVFGSLEDAEKLFETVKSTGMTYMMFETSSYRADLYAMNVIYSAGGFGKIIYAEGEYFHYMYDPIPSFKGWRVGLPPQWYPTHSNAYYISVGEGTFTEVSCL